MIKSIYRLRFVRIKKKKKGTSRDDKVEATFKYLETIKPPDFDESSNFFFPPLREITKNTGEHRRVKPTVSHTR